MKLITVATGISKGKTSTMYRIATEELKKRKEPTRILIIYEDRLATFQKDTDLFKETVYHSRVPTLSIIKSTEYHNKHVTNSVIDYFEATKAENRFDLILVDGLYSRDYLNSIKLLTVSDDSTVIMTEHLPRS